LVTLIRNILLSNVSLQDNVEDTWTLDLYFNGMHSVKESYKLIFNFVEITYFLLGCALIKGLRGEGKEGRTHFNFLNYVQCKMSF